MLTRTEVANASIFRNRIHEQYDRLTELVVELSQFADHVLWPRPTSDVFARLADARHALQDAEGELTRLIEAQTI